MARSKASITLETVAMATTLAACSWDWTLREASDGGVADAASDGPIDAASDGGRHDAGPADAARDVAQPVEVGADAPTDLGAEATGCATLWANESAAKQAAIACTLGSSDCTTLLVTDECGCKWFVARAGAATTSYTSAIAAVVSAGCATDCAGCVTPPSAGVCLESSTGFACAQ